MGNLLPIKYPLFSTIFGNSTSNGSFFSRPSIKDFSKVDYGKFILSPEDHNGHFLVLSRKDRRGNRHQILFDAKFARVLKAADKCPNIDSESEVENMNAVSDEEAEELRWKVWLKNRRRRSVSSQN